MTAHFLIDAWRFRREVFRFTQFELSLHSGKAWGTVVENFFRPSESVTDGGSFDSVRLTPHSAHDDSAFFDRRMAISPGGLSIHAIRTVAPFRQSMGDRGGKFLQAIGVRDRRGVVRLRSADASLRSR